eukprot:5185037-Pleurochrysis_carterae.AAC.2
MYGVTPATWQSDASGWQLCFTWCQLPRKFRYRCNAVQVGFISLTDRIELPYIAIFWNDAQYSDYAYSGVSPLSVNYNITACIWMDNALAFPRHSPSDEWENTSHFAEQR